MKKLLRLEEAAEFIFAVLIFNRLDFSWWVFPALLFAPDISMLGYAINTRIGAITYNFAHHKALGICIGVLGFYTDSQPLMLCGVILFAHSAMDRMLGYGLKYPDSFQNTHLGKMGK